MKLARLRLMAFCCLSSCAFGAGAVERLSIQAVAAWDGFVRTGRTSEIELRLLSPLGGMAGIEMVQGNRRTGLNLAVEAGKARTIHLPIIPAPDSPLRVMARLAGAEAEAELSFLGEEANILAVAGEAGTFVPASFGRTVTATGSLLPKTVQGYGPIDVLVLDYAILAEMSQEQLSALFHYLAQCGRVLAKNFPQEALDRLRQGAGCGGKWLAQDEGGSLETQLPPLMKGAPPGLPAAGQLEKIRPGTKQAYLPVLVLVCGYFVLLALAALIGRKQWPLFALPLFATFLALLAFGHRPPESRLILWMETASGQNSARYSALLQSTGMGRWQGERRLPVDAVISAADGETAWNLDIRPDQTVEAVAHEDAFLFSSNSWQWQRDLVVNAPMNLEERQGRLTSVNVSPHRLPKGWLNWQGRIYSLPSLASGESFSPADAKPQATRDDPLLRRLAREKAAALIPYFPESDSMPEAPNSRQGWLLIRAAHVEPAG